MISVAGEFSVTFHADQDKTITSIVYNSYGLISTSILNTAGGMFIRKANSLLIYVATPIWGNIQASLTKVKDCCTFVKGKGCYPFNPHSILSTFVEYSDIRQREYIQGCSGKFNRLLYKCDELWVFPEKVDLNKNVVIDNLMNKNYLLVLFKDKLDDEILFSIDKAKKSRIPIRIVYNMVKTK